MHALTGRTTLCLLAATALVITGCTTGKGATAPAKAPSMAAGNAQKMKPMAAAPASGTMSADMGKPDTTVEAAAVMDGVTQRITVDLSTGAYVPNQITAVTGVPIEITFGRGQGCVKRLVFPSFGIDADMTSGPRTFKLGSLAPGTYKWQCGMDMKHGSIVVK